jgi:alanine dehydrogenase
MIIGVPREIKDGECRVALTPAGTDALVHAGHVVLVEESAGEASGFADSAYRGAGARLAKDAAEVYGAADLVVKVKEPIAEEYPLLQPGKLLFTYLHLAANEALTCELIARKVTALAYETVQEPDESLPLLVPMSEVAGRMSVQIAAHFLEQTQGGSGRLVGGVAGVPPCRVVIVGGGVVGSNAAQIALGMGADVTVVDRSLPRLRYLDHALHERLTTLASNRSHIAEALARADVLIGAVLVPGARAPKVVSREMVGLMPPRSVLVDVAIDQGGCVETARPTTHSHPTYVEEGVLHYCVTNIPGIVPNTSTLALTNATLPYLLELAELGFVAAIAHSPDLAKGVNTLDGHVTNQPVAEAWGLEHLPLEGALTGMGVGLGGAAAPAR